MAVDIEQMKALISDLLHLTGAKPLPAFVPGLADLSLQKAIQEVQSALGERGFSVAQIGAWTGYDAAVKFTACARYLTLGVLLDSPENQRALLQIIKLLEQGETLKTAALFDIAGVQLIPNAGIGHGTMKIVGPDGKGNPGEPFRDWQTGTWRRD